jgi:Protein of unknown function (DUF3089)
LIASDRAATTRRRPLRAAVAAAAVAALALGVAGSSGAGAGVPHWKAWICFPNQRPDYCYVALPTTVISANGSRRVVNVPVTSTPAFDCFYLYPTVSEQHRGNSTLKVEPAELDTAIIQAARFSQVCRVFAPMYRQVTTYGNGNPFHGSYAYEYDDVLAAWRDYMAHDNEGRGFVLIGHSEGAYLFKELIQKVIERSPQERRLLISAILLGGDVRVANGSTEGGDFTNVPACTSRTKTGCVVAYASWDRTPPAAAAGQDVDRSSEHVLCVNPAAPGGGSAPITPIFAGIDPEGIAPLTKAWTSLPWVEFPGLYTARCVREGNRAWLLVTRTHTPGDRRPTVQEVLGPDRGLHAADVNIALETLVELVTSQGRSWLAHR